MRYMKQFFLRTLLNHFLDEPYVENSKRFPRDLVKRFHNILKQIKQNIKTNTRYTRGTRSSNFSVLAIITRKSIFLLLFTDCVYIDSQRPDVAYFICAIKEFRMVSFLSLFFFSLSVFMFNFLLVDSRWPFSSSLLLLCCLFFFLLLVQIPVSVKCAVWWKNLKCFLFQVSLSNYWKTSICGRFQFRIIYLFMRVNSSFPFDL